jgi:hypothetical protein
MKPFVVLAAACFGSLALNHAVAMPLVRAAPFEVTSMARDVGYVCDVYGGCWRIEPRYSVVYCYHHGAACLRGNRSTARSLYVWGGPGVGMVPLRRSRVIPL